MKYYDRNIYDEKYEKGKDVLQNIKKTGIKLKLLRSKILTQMIMVTNTIKTELILIMTYIITIYPTVSRFLALLNFF